MGAYVACRLELDRQVQEKLMRKEEDKRFDMSYGKGHMEDAERARREETERKLALLNKNKNYKKQLQEQMK
jgi:hypothetical protein